MSIIRKNFIGHSHSRFSRLDFEDRKQAVQPLFCFVLVVCCACVRACVRASARACEWVGVGGCVCVGVCASSRVCVLYIASHGNVCPREITALSPRQP